jgi:aspartyl protease family protein
MRTIWIIIAVAGLALLVWLLAGSSGDPGSTPSLVYLAILGTVVAAGILGSGRIGYALRSLAVWTLIVLALVIGYQYRYELQDVASRVTAGLVPGSPLSIIDSEGSTAVMLEKDAGGHFEARATVQGRSIRVVVDTGATSTVLTSEDASRVGIDTAALRFTVPVSTANGIARAARATVDDLSVGTISRRNLPVLVAEAGTLERSLLGMNFLGTLSGIDMRGDRLILRD